MVDQAKLIAGTDENPTNYYNEPIGLILRIFIISALQRILILNIHCNVMMVVIYILWLDNINIIQPYVTISFLDQRLDVGN